MGPAVLVANDVGVAVDALAEGVRPLKRQFNRNRALLDFFLPRDEDGFGVKGFSTGVDLLDKFRYAAGIMVLNGVALHRARP